MPSDSWRREGTPIVVRYRLLGPWTMRLRQTVTTHVWGWFLQLYEEARGGLWIDRPSLTSKNSLTLP